MHGLTLHLMLQNLVAVYLCLAMHMDRVTMGSLLSPSITSFFVEDFKELALSMACFCYTDDTFMVWHHGLKD